MAANSSQHNAEHELARAADPKYVQRLLRIGLATAVLLMSAGLVLDLIRGQLENPSVRLFHLFQTGMVLGDRLMALGILALALTPAFRVLALVYLWMKERDLKFAAVAAFVVIALSFAIALGGG